MKVLKKSPQNPAKAGFDIVNPIDRRKKKAYSWVEMKLLLKVVTGLTLFLCVVLLIPQFVFASYFDPTYGTNGMTITSFGDFFTYAGERMDIQTDDKPVVVGFVSNSGSNGNDSNTWDWKIVRYNTDGSLDTTFGNNGSVSKDFGRVDNLDAVKVQSDGKIVVGGVSQSSEEERSTLTLARYNSDGTLDASFGDNGIVRNLAGTWSSSNRIDIQPDGKIVSVGSIVSNPDFGIVTRYNTDGTPDTDFGNNGMVTIPGPSIIYSVALQTDGKIVVGGGLNGPVIVRLNSDGSFDSTFGNNGMVNIGGAYHFQDVAVQSDGKILASGNSYLWRLNSNGTVDTSFADNGLYHNTTLGSALTGLYNMFLQPDGKIVMSGVISNTSTSQDQQMTAIIRLTSTGVLDTSFGGNGAITTDLAPNAFDGFGGSPVVDTNGNLLVAGVVMNANGFPDWLIARISESAPFPTPTVTPTPTITPTPTLTPTPTPIPVPTSIQSCQNGGWMDFTNPSFQNQGQCIQYFNTH